jgi:hypothetical protein
MKLSLDVNDTTVTDYLKGFEEKERPEKAVEAMRLGIHAIRAANPALDASVVERAFASAQERMTTLVTQAQERMGALVAQAEKDVKTQMSSQFQSAFGTNGQFQALLGGAFGDNGTVRALLNKTLGPGSDFWSKLDPASRTGVLAGIEGAVKTSLDTVIQAVASQMSLDKPESAVSRLRETIEKENAKLRESVMTLVGEIQRIAGKEEGKAEEAERGAGKGMSFEDALYAAVAKMAKGFDDASENTQGTTGTIPRSKVGDAIITLGDTSAAPGSKIVMEFKMDRGYKLKTSQDEMATARRNREGQFGIMVFAKGYEPEEIGDFRKIGSDIFCTANPESLAAGEEPYLVYCAYVVARSMVVAATVSDKGGPNVSAIHQQAEALAALAERLSEITTKAQTVLNAGAAIDETAKKLQAEMRQRIVAILNEVKAGAQAVAA